MSRGIGGGLVFAYSGIIMDNKDIYGNILI